MLFPSWMDRKCLVNYFLNITEIYDFVFHANDTENCYDIILDIHKEFFSENIPMIVMLGIQLELTVTQMLTGELCVCSPKMVVKLVNTISPELFFFRLHPNILQTVYF